eukprot:c17974_g1_i1.p1 GENE.c17974_g1_i1~~c17974_g1_i1.p1  ORF type:complete len:144 (-),score=4.96 c17974_g1_i1:112-543(-)
MDDVPKLIDNLDREDILKELEKVQGALNGSLSRQVVLVSNCEKLNAEKSLSADATFKLDQLSSKLKNEIFSMQQVKQTKITIIFKKSERQKIRKYQNLTSVFYVEQICNNYLQELELSKQGRFDRDRRKNSCKQTFQLLTCRT